MGIDGGGLDDLLGLAVLGREKGTRRWLLWSKAWANPSVLDRRKSEASLLRDFEAAGELVICKEFGDDIAEITELAQQIYENGLLQAVALDSVWRGCHRRCAVRGRHFRAGRHRWHHPRLEAVRCDQDGGAQAC